MVDREELRRKRIVHAAPGMDAVAVQKDLAYTTTGEPDLLMDVYAPPGLAAADRHPAVLFVHGGPGLTRPLRTKDSGQYTSWGALVAAGGLIGVTFNHRYLGWAQLDTAAGDVEAAIEYVRAHAPALHIDAERLCLWTCSGGPPPALRGALRDRPPHVRCLVSYYGVMDVRRLRDHVPGLTEEFLTAFSPAALVAHEPETLPPLFIARAGQDRPELNATIDQFAAAALAANASLILMNHPTGRHAFDVLDDDARSHEIVAATLAFMHTHLAA